MPQGEGNSAAASRPKIRIVLIGWGAIARRFYELIVSRNPGAIALVAVAVRADRTAGAAALPDGVRAIASPADLAGLDADVVIEAAGRDCVGHWGPAALSHAKAFIVASTSAFCDDALLDKLVSVAAAHGSQLLVPPGALAGVDGLAAAGMLDLDEVTHNVVKPPAAWRGTRAEQLVDLDAMTEATAFFEGPARAAAREFPQNANVAVITALAGLGLDKTRVRLIADPHVSGNQHRIHAHGSFGRLDLTIENRALADNPKSSEITALGLARLVENRFRPMAL